MGRHGGGVYDSLEGRRRTEAAKRAGCGAAAQQQQQQDTGEDDADAIFAELDGRAKPIAPKLRPKPTPPRVKQKQQPALDGGREGGGGRNGGGRNGRPVMESAEFGTIGLGSSGTLGGWDAPSPESGGGGAARAVLPSMAAPPSEATSQPGAALSPALALDAGTAAASGA
eukprot:SAG11_NODE_10898_length_798_cov_1.163090_1_plen_169_part_10